MFKQPNEAALNEITLAVNAALMDAPMSAFDGISEFEIDVLIESCISECYEMRASAAVVVAEAIANLGK